MTSSKDANHPFFGVLSSSSSSPPRSRTLRSSASTLARSASLSPAAAAISPRASSNAAVAAAAAVLDAARLFAVASRSATARARSRSVCSRAFASAVCCARTRRASSRSRAFSPRRRRLSDASASVADDVDADVDADVEESDWVFAPPASNDVARSSGADEVPAVPAAFFSFFSFFFAGDGGGAAGNASGNRNACTSRRVAPSYPPNAISAASPLADSTTHADMPSPQTAGVGNAQRDEEESDSSASSDVAASDSSAASASAPRSTHRDSRRSNAAERSSPTDVASFPPPITHQYRSRITTAACPALGAGVGPAGRHAAHLDVARSRTKTSSKHPAEDAPAPPWTMSWSSPHAHATGNVRGISVITPLILLPAPVSRTTTPRVHASPSQRLDVQRPRVVFIRSIPPSVLSAEEHELVPDARDAHPSPRARGVGSSARREFPLDRSRVRVDVRSQHDDGFAIAQIRERALRFEPSAAAERAADEIDLALVRQQPVSRARGQRVGAARGV
eukprot:30884-Pelagococcus_subviridis.AAC.7